MTETTTRWHPVADADQLAQLAAQRILACAKASIAASGRFQLVLAGGNTPRQAYACLRDADTDWDAWHVYFSDERCLPEDDPGRNSSMAKAALLSHVPIPAQQVHAIEAERGAYAAANSYAKELKGLGHFDLVLLGLGEDGHTASLFPGQYWGIEHDSRFVLPVFKSPKPPAERVTMSANRLSRTSGLLFLVEGESKRDAVRRWREGGSIPAAAIKPSAGADVLVQASLLEDG
ncbi:MAG: 6-phosphogluconolactonase [Rhodanobacteraceae bacterium]